MIFFLLLRLALTFIFYRIRYFNCGTLTKTRKVKRKMDRKIKGEVERKVRTCRYDLIIVMI